MVSLFLTTNRRPSTISLSIRLLASSASFFARKVTKPKPYRKTILNNGLNGSENITFEPRSL